MHEWADFVAAMLRAEVGMPSEGGQAFDDDAVTSQSRAP